MKTTYDKIIKIKLEMHIRYVNVVLESFHHHIKITIKLRTTIIQNRLKSS